jgi:hypothetical protein
VHSLSRLCTSIHSSALTQCIHPLVCITSTLILASLRCTCFVIARQTFNSLSTFRANPTIVHVGHYGQPTITSSTSCNRLCDNCASVFVSLYRFKASVMLLLAKLFSHWCSIDLEPYILLPIVSRTFLHTLPQLQILLCGCRRLWLQNDQRHVHGHVLPTFLPKPVHSL